MDRQTDTYKWYSMTSAGIRDSPADVEDIWDLTSYTDRIQKQYYNVSKLVEPHIIEFKSYGDSHNSKFRTNTR
jgi:hypothetical protein